MEDSAQKACTAYTPASFKFCQDEHLQPLSLVNLCVASVADYYIEYKKAKDPTPESARHCLLYTCVSQLVLL